MSSRVIAVDVGGTFIDVVSLDRTSGEVTVEKQPSTPDRLAVEVSAALDRLPGSLSDVDRLLHGSTVAVNTLLQRSGATVGLITTRGFRDVLELGRGNRPSIYDWVWVPPEPLVPRMLRREVAERLDAHGGEIVPLDLAGLEAEVDSLLREGSRCRRGVLPACVREPEARVGGRGRDPPPPSGSPGDHLLIDRIGVARVRTDVDRRDQRIRAAPVRRLPGCAAAAAHRCGDGCADRRDAVERRGDDPRARGRPARPDPVVRTRRRSGGGGVTGPTAGTSRCDLHGRRRNHVRRGDHRERSGP